MLFQSQLTEFRSLEGQDMYTGEKIVPIKVSYHLMLVLPHRNFVILVANVSSFQYLVIIIQNCGLIGASSSSYWQLDLRVNHTLIKDQFLWVSSFRE